MNKLNKIAKKVFQSFMIDLIAKRIILSKKNEKLIPGHYDENNTVFDNNIDFYYDGKSITIKKDENGKIDFILKPDYTFVWNKGVWEKGSFVGVFNNGLFNNGIIEKGSKILGGEFKGGVFKGDLIQNTIWYDGIFDAPSTSWGKDNMNENGDLLEQPPFVQSKDIEYKNFTGNLSYNGLKIKAKNAFFKLKNGSIIWYDGIFEDGIWNKGIWEDGTWKNGTWLYGIWENGKWMHGYDKNGNEHGEDDSPDKWNVIYTRSNHSQNHHEQRRDMIKSILFPTTDKYGKALVRLEQVDDGERKMFVIYDTGVQVIYRFPTVNKNGQLELNEITAIPACLDAVNKAYNGWSERYPNIILGFEGKPPYNPITVPNHKRAIPDKLKRIALANTLSQFYKDDASMSTSWNNSTKAQIYKKWYSDFNRILTLNPDQLEQEVKDITIEMDVWKYINRPKLRDSIKKSKYWKEIEKQLYNQGFF